MPIVPESPRFLVKKGRTEEAKKILAKIYPGAPREFLNDVPKQDTCADYGTRCGACLIDDRCGFSKLKDVCVDKTSLSSDQLYGSCPSTSIGGNWFTLSSLVVFVA
ncbi:16437_t:CDS:2, partial [Racocetra fulgida]